jgi:L-ascorbate metabolism protein UlaG (beta-lactamase superfamily)
MRCLLSSRQEKIEETTFMKITWYGQSAFRVEAGGAKILIDPFLSQNPSWGKGWEGPAEGITHLLLTHGHNDHIGDSVEILKKTGAQLVANFEICMYLVGKGASGDKINPGNLGGTVDCGGFTTTFVQALHSSSFGGEGGSNVYLGNPGGLVLHFPDDRTLYHMGDTDIFSDMALINELHEPKIGLVPVGDRYTMGGAVAALACQRFFKFETVIPCHYATFPMLDQTAEKFVDGMEGSGVDVIVPKVGESRDI